MPFKRRTSEPATTSVATETTSEVQSVAPSVETPADGIRLTDQIEIFASQVSAALQSSMALSPDVEYLPAPLQDALKRVAKKIGFDYKPTETGTFYFVVTETAAKYLSGPALVQVGGVAHIRWGNEYIELSNQTSLYSDTWRLIQGGEKENSVALFDPKGLAFPVAIRPDVSSKEDAEKFRKALGTVDTFGDLVQWLRNGIFPQGLYKLDDGESFQIESVSDLVDARSGESKYRIVDAIYQDDTPCRWYVSDVQDVNWGSLALPAVCTRNGQYLDIEQESGNLAYKIQFPVMKMGDALREGQTYPVLSYETEEGKYGTQYNMTLRVDGDPQKVRANMALEDRLKYLSTVGQDDFSKNPAHLIVDSIKTSRDGKVRVSARLITKSDLENPLMQKLMQAQKTA